MLRVLMAIDSYRVSGPAKGLLDFCDAARGRVQPLERNADRRNYMISHALPVEVEVK